MSLQQYLEMPALAWDYLTLFAPEPYDAYFRIADLHRAEGADFVVGGRRYGSFAHDFRVVPLEPLLEVWSERALAQDFVPPAPAAAAEVLVLSEGEFGAAVKQALRDLHTPAKLAKNPLQRARLVRDATPGETPDPSVLASLLRDAIAELGVDPCDRDRHLAVEKTYLDPAPNQEAAAERLGRPFSSYRRHLTQGIERVVQRLWQRELYGSEPHHE